MTKTIHTALSPLLIVGSLCGLCFLEYPLGRIRPYLSSLYFLITWSLYGYLLYYLVPTSEIPTVFLHWTNIIITISAVMSMLVSLFRFKELKMCLHKLSILDDTLEVLGTPKEYRRLYNCMIGITIAWILTACFTNALDVLDWTEADISMIVQICVPFLLNHVLHVNTISSLIWGTILGYTGTRFQRINEYINKFLQHNVRYTVQQNDGISIDRRKIKTKEYEQSMWIIMHVHLQLCRISRELNKVFSMQMTLEMASLFTFVVEMFIGFYDFYVYFYTDDHVNTFDIVIESLILYIWTTIYIAKLFALNYICQTVCDKANATIAILYKLSNNCVNEGLREQILQFILQIKQREVKFSGMGLFYFGNSFVRKFFMSIMTVVVIIVQMRTSHARNNNTSN